MPNRLLTTVLVPQRVEVPCNVMKVDNNEKAKLQAFLICLAGNEVTSSNVGKKESDLEPAMLERYKNWESRLSSDYPMLLRPSIYTLDVLLMNEKKLFTGKVLWRRFGELKCEIVNQFNPLWREEKSGESVEDIYQEILQKLWEKEEMRLAPNRKNSLCVPYNFDMHKKWRPQCWYVFIYLSLPSDNCLKVFELPVRQHFLYY